MLNLPISEVESIIFVILLGAWAGFLFGGFMLGTPSEDETRRMPLVTRLLSSVVLVVAAWIWFAISQGTSVATLSVWVAIGMTFGLLGDLFMAEVFDLEPYVLYGMVAFGVGHVAYIIGLALLVFAEDMARLTVILSFASWWSIAAGLWYLVVYRRSKPGILSTAALPYALLLATTVVMAMLATFTNMTFVLIFTGAILFLISDLLLAAQLFGRLHFRYISDVVWFLYGPGQMLIVLGVILYTMVGNMALVP